MTLVSVVVPIFGVEAELPRCVDSILAQTYPHLQIILVDDGSPDRCGALCDAYATADHRVEVIHQANGGVSVARNTGLDGVRGQYVTFVDGDDWLDPRFVETLLNAARQCEAQVSCSQFVRTSGEASDITFEPHARAEVRCLTGDEALTESFEDSHTMWAVTWAKLYQVHIWENLRFPPGRIQEDESTTFKAVHRAERVAVLNAPLYAYRQRPGSLTGVPPTVASRWDASAAAGEQLKYVQAHRQDLVVPAARRLVRKQLALHRALADAGAPQTATELARLHETASLLQERSRRDPVAWAALTYIKAPRVMRRAQDAYTAVSPRTRWRERRGGQNSPRPLRVLISASWLGGAGGAERALHSVLMALQEDHVDVVVRTRLDGPLSVVPAGVRVYSYSDRRWWAAGHRTGTKGWAIQRLLNPIRRLVLPRYDVLLRSFNGPGLETLTHARLRLVVPSGNVLDARTARDYHYVAMQAPDNVLFVPDGQPVTLLPPPLMPLPPATAPPIDLPDEFVLTVFNPYDAVKGMAEMAQVADTAPMPIVWCHSRRTVNFDIPVTLAQHANIIHVDDPSQGELRFLYERCSAYLSFSKAEGFGWSIADALRYSPGVISRKIGVLTFPQAVEECPVQTVTAFDEIDWAWVANQRRPETPRELAWLSPQAFRTRLSDLIVSAP